MKRLRFQIILLALCLVAVLAAKSYVDRFLRQSQGAGVAHEVPLRDGAATPAGTSLGEGVTVQADAPPPAAAREDTAATSPASGAMASKP